MGDKPATTGRSTTVRIADNGGLSLDVGSGSFAAGFSQLMDFTAPSFAPKLLAAEETTKIGFVRTGDAIARALRKARDRFRG